MTTATIVLDDELDSHVRRLAAQKGLSAESLLRQAIADYVRRHRQATSRLSFVGVGRSGRSDVAERHEEILAADWSGAEGS